MQMAQARVRLGRLEPSMRHIHRGIECVLLVSGRVTLELDGVAYPLEADDLVLINSCQIHAVLSAGENVAVCLRLPSEFIERECRALCGAAFTCNSKLATLENAVSYFEAKRLLVRLLLVFAEKREGYELEYKAGLLQLLHHFQTHFKRAQDHAVAIQQEEQGEGLADTLAYIAENYRESLPLEALARRQFVSPQYFSKRFKQKMGVGLLEYITDQRLEHALGDLLYTKESILKIAMENGFANAKSFAASFQKRFGQPPSEYRRQHQPQSGQEKDMVRDLDGGSGEDLQQLLGYMRSYNLTLSPQTETVGRTILALNQPDGRRLQKPDGIINIGRLAAVLQQETLRQLEQAQPRLQFRYARFHSLFEIQPQGLQQNIFFADYGQYRALQQLYGLGLIPYWTLDISTLKQQGGPDATRLFYRRLTEFLDFLAQSFTPGQLCGWRVELGCSLLQDQEEFAAFYVQVAQLLRARIGCNPGLLAFRQDTPDQREVFLRVLRAAGETGTWPAFVSFYGDPDSDRRSVGTSAQALRQMERYHEELATQMEQLLRRENCPPCPLYMPNWNTLSGKELTQSGTFFRSALTLDVMVRLSGKVAAMGFWLNTYEEAVTRQQADTSMLALYLYFNARRPVYFVLDAFRRLGEQLLYRDDYVLATRGRQGEYTLMIYNPCYENPLHTLDAVYVDQIKRRLELVLEGLTPGNYQFKRFVLDKDSAGIFSWWEKAGATGAKDEDLIEYMNAIVPQMFLFTDQVQGSYSLYPELTFNGIVVYIIKKI